MKPKDIFKLPVTLFSVLFIQFAQCVEVDLLTFVSIVQERNVEALAIEEDILTLDLDLEDTRQDFDFQWRPSANLNLSNNSTSQGVGIEVSKKNEYGTRFSVASNYEEFRSDFSTQTSKSPTVSIGVEQSLFRNWGRDINRLPLTKSEINKDKNYWSIVARKQALIRSAIQRYFDVLVAEKQYLLRKLSVERAIKNLEVTESRYGLGLVSKIDVYRTELAVLNSQESEKSELRSLKRSKRAVNNLINLDSELDIQFVDDVKSFRFIMPDRYLDIALQARSDWQISLLDDKLVKLDLMQAKKQLMPDIRLSISAKKYLETFETFSGNLNESINWNIGLTYNTPFDVTREENALTRQMIRSRQQQRRREQLRRRIIQEINDAIDNLNLAQDRVMIAEQRLIQSEKAVELSKIRFQRGLSNNLDLVEAENAFQAASNDLLNQKIQVNLSKVFLAEELGILDIKWLENAVNR